MEELSCRVCSSTGCKKSLSETLGDTSIISALRTITGVQMSLNDGLPQHICSACLAQLIEAVALRTMCIATDCVLRHTAEYNIDRNTKQHNFLQLLQKIEQRRPVTAKPKQKNKKKRVKAVKEFKKEKAKIKKDLGFKCNPCSLKFSTKEQLKAHRATRLCSRHPCHICGHLVVSLRSHVRATHGGAQHDCHVCGKKFPILARLRAHQRVHEDKFGFECAHCDYKSKHKYYLVLHLRTHTGERPHVCACGAAFVNPSNLNKHRLTHGDRQFACGLCDKIFRLNSTLREHHQAAHLRLKHTCALCGRDFCYKSELRKHEIRTHNRAKRVGGGEPTYKRLERVRRERDSAAHVQSGAPWRPAELKNIELQEAADCSNETAPAEHRADESVESCPTPAIDY